MPPPTRYGGGGGGGGGSKKTPSYSKTNTDNNNNYYYWRFRMRRLLGHFVPICLFIDIFAILYLRHWYITQSPITSGGGDPRLGVRIPGGDGIRTPNLPMSVR